ncbi:MAG: proline--tRNA ligase [Calditrichaeota bacterium]|nr:proline--tRNA ligase [Candidatus Cloacimonadota bacterium]MCB1046503.1 proline--tRNA ligase [Calditrichota bacterium]MCB9475032.1 proline--tRNA ligase [Candidatus Delongbacteria bacterium]
MARNITPRDKDYPQWYLDVIKAGELADHAPVKGCMVIRPTGYALWESIQQDLDRRFKETGHVNAYFPLLIPESFMTKEAEHVEGFAPECAVVTHGGGKKLEEPLMIRPTSETIFGHMYSKWLTSWRDLPILINQWANVMRWELRTRLFLRTAEFLWQEGHTAHETAEEAQEETQRMLEVYRDFAQDYLAIPVVTGRKTEQEKFPGAVATYCIEGMMQDGKALQMGTSHNLGQNFAKAFEIQFSGRDNQLAFAWTTSWGVSTRLIGALIMVHSDDDGLVLPPRMAPTKGVVIPLWKNDEERAVVEPFADQALAILRGRLGKLNVVLDSRHDDRPADRFFHWAQKGVPFRLEIGIRDATQGTVCLVTRHDRKKHFLSLADLESGIDALLESMQAELFQRALALRESRTVQADSWQEFQEAIAAGKWVRAHWDGSTATELAIKEATKATIRCIPDDSQPEEGRCVFSQQPSSRRVLFALNY